MNLLDENFPADQAAQLRAWRVSCRQIGHGVARLGTQDAEIIPQRAVRDDRYKFILNLNPENRWTTHFTKVMDIPDSHGDVYSTWTAAAQTNAAAAKLVQAIERHTPEEFYDTQADPFELNNLIADPAHRERIAALRGKLVAWMRQQGDAGTPEP